MQVHVSIGENHRFELREALLVYRDRQSSFITCHDVTVHKHAPPTLGPAQPLTVAFIESLVRSLSGGCEADVFLVDPGATSSDVLRELRREGRGAERPFLPSTSSGVAGLEWRAHHPGAHRKQTA